MRKTDSKLIIMFLFTVVLNIHLYKAAIGDPVAGTVVAFTSEPRKNDTEMHTLGCFDRSSSSSSVDEEDETEIDGEACQCLSGSTIGPLMLEVSLHNYMTVYYLQSCRHGIEKPSTGIYLENSE